MKYIKPLLQSCVLGNFGSGKTLGCLYNIDNIIKAYEDYLMDGLKICFGNKFNSVKSL